MEAEEFSFKFKQKKELYFPSNGIGLLLNHSEESLTEH